jgi:glycosyltransferase involved in cell wall biosynthesis
MKVALVHDYLVEAGGAERTLLELHYLFPEAPIFTAVYDPRTTFPEFAKCDVRPSALLKPFSTQRRYKYALPLYPFVFERISLADYDVVLSSASAFAKAVQTASHTKHICYCYTPTRYLWYWDEYRRRESLRGPRLVLIQALRPRLRKVDARAARRVDQFLANSHNVRKRIRASYGREADVVYTPVSLERFPLSTTSGQHFLVVSRLNRYKRVDQAICAFNRLRLPLIIAGTGDDEARLRRLAGPTVQLVGKVSEAELRELYGAARAVVVPGEEDLGLAPLEASATGKPVVALGRGGATETVVNGKTGVLYDTPTVEELIAAVERLSELHFEPAELREHASRFSVDEFRSGIVRAVESQVGAAVDA